MSEVHNPQTGGCLAGRVCAFLYRGRSEDGFIVVAVLWILVLLAALISVYAIHVSNAAVSLSVNDDRLQSEALTSAALELTAYQLTSGDPNLPTRGEFAFRMGRSDVAVTFRSEASLIDLNAAPKELLAGLCAALGASPDRAAYFADRIVGWRTKPAGGGDDEADAYRNAGLNYAPRQAPFASVGELWLVLGLRPVLVQRMLPYVTVFSGQSGVDVLDAASEVIAALPGMSPSRVYAVLSARQKAPQDEEALTALLGPAQNFAVHAAGMATRVNVVIGFDNGRRVGAEAVILPLKDADRPYHILYWRDDFDGGA